MLYNLPTTDSQWLLTMLYYDRMRVFIKPTFICSRLNDTLPPAVSSLRSENVARASVIDVW